MGIKNLHTFIRKINKDIYKTVNLQKLAGKTLAVDTSIFMCKYKSMLGSRWLSGFWNLILCMKRNQINLIFIYDTKAPPEKDEERLLRQEQRDKQKERVSNIMKDWMKVEQEMKIGNEKIDKNEFLEKIESYSSLYLFLKKSEFESKYDIINLLNKVEKTVITITVDDFNLTKKLFKIMGISCQDAFGEAEATCSFLNRIGIVDGVLTEDTDVLAYRTPSMYHNINTKENTVVQLDIKSILEELELEENEFLDFCILCGTDYNQNLNLIGPQKSYQLIKKYKTIDQFDTEDKLFNKKAKEQLIQLNYERIRKLFNPDYEYNDDRELNNEINKNELKNFCFYNNLRYELLN